MKEVLVNSISNIYYDVFVSGELTDATGSVTLNVFKDGIKIVDAATATKVGSTTGKYSYTLPVAAVSTETELEVDWTFTVGSNTLTIREYYSVVTPYAPWSYFNDAGKTYEDYIECERVARYLINTYCGQSFGFRTTTYAIEGHGTDSLKLPSRLITLTDVSWWDGTTRPGSIIGWSSPQWEITADGWVLRTQPNSIHIDPAYNPEAIFRRNRLFNIEGVWGYLAVPTGVEEAAKIIIADYMCADHKYRDKYLDSIKMGDLAWKYNSGAWHGTGNATADMLLTDYRNYPGVGII